MCLGSPIPYLGNLGCLNQIVLAQIQQIESSNISCDPRGNVKVSQMQSPTCY